MPSTRSRHRLAEAVEALWQAVSELVLTVVEDRPEGMDLAAVDALSDVVTDLQGDVAAARADIHRTPSDVPLPDVTKHMHDALWRYWSELRATKPVGRLRTATAARGVEVVAWRRSVEASCRRIEEPLAEVQRELIERWSELYERFDLVTRTSGSGIQPAPTPPPHIRRPS